MQFVPGSHREGALEHRELGLDGTRVLGQQVVQPESFDHRFFNVLKAGQASMHSDLLLHGSDANHSDRPRCGITMRFSPTEVKADLNVWPSFSIQMSRGQDEFNHNPIAPTPRGEAVPTKGMQFFSDFEKEW